MLVHLPSPGEQLPASSLLSKVEQYDEQGPQVWNLAHINWSLTFYSIENT